MTIEEVIKRLQHIIALYDCRTDEDNVAVDMAIVALNFWKDVKNGQFIIYRAARGSGKSDLKGIGYTKEQIEEAFNDVVRFNSFLINIINEKYNDYLGGVREHE